MEFNSGFKGLMLTLNRLLLKRGYSIINNLNILALIISILIFCQRWYRDVGRGWQTSGSVCSI